MSEEVSEEVDLAIGIDLGTTYSCVGIWNTNRVEIIHTEEGDKTVPSWVSFTGTEKLVGKYAKMQRKQNIKNTVYDVKRLIGRTYNDPIVQKDIKYYLYNVSEGKDKSININVEYKNEKKSYVPEEISSFILMKMKQIAEKYVQKHMSNYGEYREIKKAVITVPAYFTDSQRQATKLAGKLAGLEVLRIINEPTAASMAYGFDKDVDENILVFDLGGGTFDVSLLTLSNGIYEVRATAGDPHLGGEDFDLLLSEYIINKFYEKFGKFRLTEKSLNEIRIISEKTKRKLSTEKEVNIIIEIRGKELNLTITRNDFNKTCDELFRKCITPINKVLSDSKILKSKVNEIVLVGGSTRIPRIQEMLSEFFNGRKLNNSINPDEAVAYGAAIQAAILSKAKDTSGKLEDTILMDVSPLSLGLETSGGLMTILIPRNTSIPVQKTQVFSTHTDDQIGVLVKVFEGERGLTKDNHLLGSFQLDGIPPMPRGIPQIDVKYELDENCILNISAKETSSGINKSVTVSNKRTGMCKEDIDRLVQDSEKYMEEDNVARDHIKSRNELENYCYSLRNCINGFKDKEKIIKLIKEGLELVDKNVSTEIYKEKLEEFQNIVSEGNNIESTSITDL